MRRIAASVILIALLILLASCGTKEKEPVKTAVKTAIIVFPDRVETIAVERWSLYNAHAAIVCKDGRVIRTSYENIILIEEKK